MNKFWWWIFNQEWIPLGRLAPYVLGWALRRKPHKMKQTKADWVKEEK